MSLLHGQAKTQTQCQNQGKVLPTGICSRFRVHPPSSNPCFFSLTTSFYYHRGLSIETWRNNLRLCSISSYRLKVLNRM